MGIALPQRIFVSGKMGAGKDSLADELARRRGYLKIHMVEPFKLWAAHELGITREELEANKSKYRDFLQERAVEWRGSNPYRMIELLDAHLQQINGPVVVTGVRFVNEAVWAAQNGGLVIKLLTPENIRLERMIARELSVLPVKTLEIAESIRNDIIERMGHPTELEVEAIPAHITITEYVPLGAYLEAIEEKILLWQNSWSQWYSVTPIAAAA